MAAASEATENSTHLVTIEVAQQITVNSTQLRDIALTVKFEGIGEHRGPVTLRYQPEYISFV